MMQPEERARLDEAERFDYAARLARREGRLGAAETLYWHALAMREEVLGPEHTYIAISLNNLGRFYQEERRYAEAEPLLRRAVVLWEKAVGSEHENTARARRHLANLAVARRTGAARGRGQRKNENGLS